MNKENCWNLQVDIRLRDFINFFVDFMFQNRTHLLLGKFQCFFTFKDNWFQSALYLQHTVVIEELFSLCCNDILCKLLRNIFRSGNDQVALHLNVSSFTYFFSSTRGCSSTFELGFALDTGVINNCFYFNNPKGPEDQLAFHNFTFLG